MALVEKNLAEIVTLSRASARMNTNSAGTLTALASGAFGIDYDPATLAKRGMPVEEQRTNLLLWSQSFETGAWFSGASISANSTTSPSGTLTADTLTTTGAAASTYQTVAASPSTVYTASVYVKLGTMLAADYKVAAYDATAAAFIAADVVPTEVVSSGAWTRITHTFTTPVGCTSLRWYPFRNSDVLASCTVIIWGAQLEAGSFASSYMGETTTAAITRLKDLLTVDTTSPWYNQTEGTWFVQWLLGPDVTSASIINTNDGTSDNSIALRYSAGGTASQLAVTTGAVAQASMTTGANLVANTVYQAAFRYKTNDFAVSYGGAASLTDVSGTVPTVTRVSLMSNALNIEQPSAWLQKAIYYPATKTNAQLEALATA